MGRTQKEHRAARLRVVGDDRRRLRVAGVFAGVGGLELGLEEAGHETIFLCEKDAAARSVLDTNFPLVPQKGRHGSIATLRRLPARTQLLAAGFPCQDLSQVGRCDGIWGTKSGLVAHVFRLLRKTRVPWVLLENVPFMLHLGRGRALHVIADTLESLGYSWAYREVDARAFGLPQRRRRVFLLASLREDPRSVLFADDAGEPKDPPTDAGVACGFYWTEGNRGTGWAVNAVPTLKGGSAIGIPSPPAIVLPSDAVVTPDIRDAERLQGFPADWTKPAEEVGRASFRWKLVGNAVAVPVARWLGGRLRSPGKWVDDEPEPLERGSRLPPAAWGHPERGRFVAEVSAWPLKRTIPPLHRFLQYDAAPLSQKAAAGFYQRLQASTLNIPPRLERALELHLGRRRQRQTA